MAKSKAKNHVEEEVVQDIAVVEEKAATLDFTSDATAAGVEYDTNPTHNAGEQYDDYRARVRAAGVVHPASAAEWANAVQV